MKKLSILLFFCCAHFFSSAQWYQLNSGTNAFFSDVFFINSDTGFVVGSQGTGIVLKTTNGGLTWNSLNYGSSSSVYGVSFPSDQVGFICGDGISKTTDQGNIWNTVLNGYYGAPKQIQFLNDSVGYAREDFADFLKTNDGGQTWNLLLPPTDETFDFYFSSVDTGMMTDLYNEHEVSVTYDGGVTWTESLAGGAYSNSFACVTHIENQKWLAIRNDNAIYADITNDAGQTWTDTLMDSVPAQFNVSFPFKDVVFPTATEGWAVGSYYIINSHDGGFSWAVNDTTPDSLFKVFFPNPQVGYAVGSHGLIMKYVASASCSANFNLVADTSILHHYWGVNTSTGIPPLNYYWSWGDGTYDSIPYPSHIYSSAGFYTICLTIHDTTGCADSTCYSYQIQKMSSAEAENTMVYVDIVPNIPTAAQNAEAQGQLFVFPNPVQSQLFINLTSPANEVAIRVYDLHGRMIALPMTLVTSQVQLNTTSLSDGFYTVQIINNKTGKIEVGKFVRQ